MWFPDVFILCAQLRVSLALVGSGGDGDNGVPSSLVGGVARLVPHGAICNFLIFWGGSVPVLIFNIISVSSHKKNS